MKSLLSPPSYFRYLLFSYFISLFLFCMIGPTTILAADSTQQTLIVSAEGLADPAADTYKRDKGILIDDLRRDAKRQVIEKAVGVYVESSSLIENYALVSDKVLSQSAGLIKRIIKETPPWLGEDGFMHMFIKAEVYLTDIKNALKTMSKVDRIDLIKEKGNPTISVSVLVKDAKRGSNLPPERSQVAENLLKEHFVGFGYRVWSEDYTRVLRQEQDAELSQRRLADFSVIGETKFKTNSITLQASGLTLTKHILTSWTVKCINNHTGEEIYFNNKIPKNKSWNDEDQALADIGRLIGKEFSEDFFKDQLMKPSKVFQVEIIDLPNYDIGIAFKKEFIGLRPVLNADLRNFNAHGVSVYEIEFTGSTENFGQMINSSIIKPLNSKLGASTFTLLAHHGDVVTIRVSKGSDPQIMQSKLKSMPPASLAVAAPQRIEELVANPAILTKVKEMNKSLDKGGTGQITPASSSDMNTIESF